MGFWVPGVKIPPAVDVKMLIKSANEGIESTIIMGINN